eukprot:13915467-Ditylum_brightwellii.AAC.1
MERNMKLKLEAYEFLAIKTFKNKLPILCCQKMGKSNATRLVTLTKDTWLPGLGKYMQWEMSNSLGGMKIVLQEQFVTVEQQICFLNTISTYISDTYQDLSSPGFPSQITWLLVAKLIYQVFAGDLEEVLSRTISH